MLDTVIVITIRVVDRIEMNSKNKERSAFGFECKGWKSAESMNKFCNQCNHRTMASCLLPRFINKLCIPSSFVNSQSCVVSYFIRSFKLVLSVMKFGS